jgi:hypothetical protein
MIFARAVEPLRKELSAMSSQRSAASKTTRR